MAASRLAGLLSGSVIWQVGCLRPVFVPHPHPVLCAVMEQSQHIEEKSLFERDSPYLRQMPKVVSGKILKFSVNNHLMSVFLTLLCHF